MIPARALPRPLVTTTRRFLASSQKIPARSLLPKARAVLSPSRPYSATPVSQFRRSSALYTSAAAIPELSLAGKTVIITGGARGLGLVQARACLESGATVYALDRLPEPSAEFFDVQKDFKEGKNGLSYRQIDVRDVDQLNETVSTIASDSGGIDGLIAAAGIQQETPALEYSQEDARRMMDINVIGVFMTAQAVAREMVKRDKGGSLVFIASMSGTVANKGLICPAYNASKAAVLQLARNLAAEWGRFGIRVNTISPGYIVTKMVEDLFVEFPERRDEWPKQNMLGKLSKPEDYRGAAVFLLSDASGFMTGADLRIDGGHCAW